MHLTALVGALGLCGCRISILARDLDYALGTKVEIHRVYGTCKLVWARSRRALRPLDAGGSTYQAEREGRYTLSCSSGSLRVHVRPVARLAILSYAYTGPEGVDHTSRPDLAASPLGIHDRLWLVPKAFDAKGRELILSGGAVTWEIRGVLERCAGPGCLHGRCPPPNSVNAKPRAEGQGEVVVRLGGREAVARFVVRGR